MLLGKFGARQVTVLCFCLKDINHSSISRVWANLPSVYSPLYNPNDPFIMHKIVVFFST